MARRNQRTRLKPLFGFLRSLPRRLVRLVLRTLANKDVTSKTGTRKRRTDETITAQAPKATVKATVPVKATVRAPARVPTKVIAKEAAAKAWAPVANRAAYAATRSKSSKSQRLVVPADVTFTYEGRVLVGVLERVQRKRRLIHVSKDPAHKLDRAGGAVAFLAADIEIIEVHPLPPGSRGARPNKQALRAA